MKHDTVEKFILERPFRPFRLLLQSGEEITVRKPRSALISGPSVVVVGISRARKGNAGIERFRIIRLNEISAAEPAAETGIP